MVKMQYLEILEYLSVILKKFYLGKQNRKD